MVTRKPQYTGEEALWKIPIIAKRVALSSIDLVIQLENYPVNSHEIESRMWALSGQIGHMNRLFHTYWKAEAKKKPTTGGADKRPGSIRGGRVKSPKD